MEVLFTNIIILNKNLKKSNNLPSTNLKIINIHITSIPMMIMTRRTFLCSLMCLTANHLETLKSHTRCRSRKLTTNEQAINSIKNLIKFPKYVISQGTKQKSSLIIFTKYMNHKVNFHFKISFMYSSFTIMDGFRLLWS